MINLIIGEILEKDTWFEYVGEIKSDTNEPDRAEFYCWDVTYQDRTFTISGFGSGNFRFIFKNISVTKKLIFFY